MSENDRVEQTSRDPEEELAPCVDRDLHPDENATESPDLVPQLEEQPSLLFQSWCNIEEPSSTRIPNFGHLGILAVITLLGLIGTALITRSALSFHLFGISAVKDAVTDIHYTLGSMAVLYLLTLLASVFVFPLFWNKGFFAGLQWRGDTAMRLHWRLFSAALICFGLALVNGWLLPGPADTPIDKLFRTPAAAWFMFSFGITFAPFFEEMAFRGFLLPALCTALDWAVEKAHDEPPPPLDDNGHPQWSVAAMAVASVLTSVPFAMMHAEQTGYSVGPILLLIGVSLVLCWIRLRTRSLAASVLVHAWYNFLLFSLMLVSTGGFRHLEKM